MRHPRGTVKCTLSGKLDFASCHQVRLHLFSVSKYFIRLVLAEDKLYCAEHSVNEPLTDKESHRVACPLDPKHTVDKRKLEKHLFVCNAKKPTEFPDYIKPGCNLGEPAAEDDEEFRLNEVPQSTLDPIIKLINELFEKHVAGTIETNHREHEVLAGELSVESYGAEKRRHLQQTSSILGIMELEGFLKPKTFFIEYGAGKAALTFWLASAIEKLEGAKILVVDRESHRYKKDNQITNRDLVERIRADISDLDLQHLDSVKQCESMIGVSKHLCGGATDLALRCMVQGNQNGVKSKGFIICLCCHHRCTWNTFVGKDWLVQNGIDKKTFDLVIKMVSWCVCGERQNRNVSLETTEREAERKEREEVGWKCKRILDHARLHYLSTNDYDAKMSFYADKSTTLENVCITGHLKV